MKHNCHVDLLVCAEQGKAKILQLSKIKYSTVERAFLDKTFRAVYRIVWRIAKLCNLTDRSTGRAALTAVQTGSSFLDDACLFGGDCLNGIPQQSGVVEINARDDREHGSLNDVGRVEPAAQSDLQNDDIAPFSTEIFKRDRGNQLKFGRLILHVVGNRTDQLGQF